MGDFNAENYLRIAYIKAIKQSEQWGEKVNINHNPFIFQLQK
jgi:hypothetical protein